MRKLILLALALVFAAVAAACDADLAGATTVVDSMTVPEIGDDSVEGETLPDGARAAVEEPLVSIEPVSTPVPVFEDSTSASVVPVQTATPGAAESFAYDDENSVTVRYFDMENQKETETQYPVTDPSDPIAVVDGVTSALRDVLGDQDIKVSTTNYSNGNLFVDFDSSIYGLGMSSADENQVLNSIADTYLSNVQGIKAVYYTVDGEPYQSEHTTLFAGEAYKTAQG